MLWSSSPPTVTACGAVAGGRQRARAVVAGGGDDEHSRRNEPRDGGIDGIGRKLAHRVAADGQADDADVEIAVVPLDPRERAQDARVGDCAGVVLHGEQR